MAKSKKKSISNTWAPTFPSRYIFFQSLKNAKGSLGGLSIHMSNVFGSLSIKQEEEQKRQQSLQYISNYITMLTKLAEKEQSQEKKYLQSIARNGFDENKFKNTDGSFNYLAFIKELNLANSNIEFLRKTIKTNINNIQQIEQEMKKFSQQEERTYKRLKVNAKNKDDTIDIVTNEDEYIKRGYVVAYQKYIEEMQKRVNSSYAKTLNEQFTALVNKVISNIAYNKKILTQITNACTNLGIPESALLTTIQNLCVEAVRQEAQNVKWNLKQINVKQLINNLNGTAQLDQLIERAANSMANKVMDSQNSVIQQILDNSLKDGRGIAKRLEETPESLDELLNTIGANQTEKKQIKKLFSNDQKALKNKNNKKTNGAIERAELKLTQTRHQLTKEINRIIKKIDNKTYSKKEEREIAVNKIISTYISSSTPATVQQALINSLSSRLKVTNLSDNSAAEILSSPEFHNFLQNHITDIFIPGKSIQYKHDLAFGVSLQPLEDTQLLKYFTNMPYWIETYAEERGRLFLEAYKATAGGATSVSLAAEAYRNVLSASLASKKAMLVQADENLHDKIEEYFSGQLDGAISVKEYKFYDNNQGFHAGSLGGSGKVVDAIPQIAQMLELGGITLPDTELIIDALLNCFSESLIGDTGLLDDLKSLLIGGAAMMLFDDGFANCENFINRLVSEFQLSNAKELPTGGSVHILYLNNIYMPQSYILFNVIDQLKKIQADLNGDVFEPSEAQNSLYLNNPMSESMLKEVEDLPTPAERWNAISSYAQENVTIHFLFMAGMLDILQSLENLDI